MRRGILLSCLATVGLIGCQTAPHLPVAQAPLPVSFSETARSEAVAELAWWRDLPDPTLADLVEAAGNVAVVAVAEQRLREAAELARAAGAEVGPTIGLTLSQAVLVDDELERSDSATIGIEGRLPLDLGGGSRSRAAAARSRVEEADARLADVRLRSRISAARLYLAVRSAQAQRDAAQESLAAGEDLLRLAQSRQSSGLGTGLESAQARTAISRAAAAIPAIERAERQAVLALEALLGDAAASGLRRVQSEVEPPQFNLRHLLTQPADLLLNRPDLRARAARLYAFGLDARAARADRLPQMSLQALLSESTGLPGPTAAGLRVGLDVLAVLFDGNRLDATAGATEAREAAALAEYQQAVRDAFAEVETALEAIRSGEEEIAALSTMVVAASDEAVIARARYQARLFDLSEVRLAEIAAADAALMLIRAKVALADAHLSLVLALGAGSNT